jgi:hypothetical protein
MRWIVVVALLVWTLTAHAEPPETERQPPPVGGLFGLFGRSRPKPTPTEPEALAPAVRETEKPMVVPTAPPPPTAAPTIAPEPTATSRPLPSPTPGRRAKKGAKLEPTPTPSETPEEGAEREGGEGVEEEDALRRTTPESAPGGLEERGDRGVAPETRPAPPGEAATREERAGGGSDVRLPSVEIQGELEKPDIFFVLPRARDQSDEQLMRSRIKREITRPVIKDWIEEEMLLK